MSTSAKSQPSCAHRDPLLFVVRDFRHRVDRPASSKNREPTSAMSVNEPGLGSSADGKGEEGINRSFERTATPLQLGE